MSYGRTVEHNNSNRNDYNDKRKYDDINRGDDNRRRSFNGGGDDRRNSFNGGRGNRQPFVARKTGGMVEHKAAVLPVQVQMAKQILTRLGDFSAMTEIDDLASNIKQLAELLVSLEDLKEFAEEISDLFIQCFTQLSVQTPILATLLGVIFQSNSTFPNIVMDKLKVRLLLALSNDDVHVAKLILRALASLASSSCMLLDGPGSITSLLDVLINITETSWSDEKNGEKVLEHRGQISAYLLATTIPWVATVLSSNSDSDINDDEKGKELLERAKSLCMRVCAEWKSPFEVGGKQAVFHVAIVHATDSTVLADSMTESGIPGLTPLGPIGATCWDSLYEACSVAVEVIQAATGSEGFLTPSVMCTPWNDLKDELKRKVDDEGENLPEKLALLTLGESFELDVKALAQGGQIGARGRYCYPNGGAKGCGTSLWLQPRFPVFDAETCPDCVSCSVLSSLEKYTIMGYYRDIMQFFDPYLREDGTRTGSVETMIAHLVAVSKMFPPMSTEGTDGAEAFAGTETIRLEYLLIETMFQMLLQQPSAHTANSCLMRVILDTSKKNPIFAPAVALGIGILYNLLPEMDICASKELARALAYHLNNTKLAWPYWEHWASDCVEGAEGSSTSMFCASVIDHCWRVSIPERVKSALPKGMHYMVSSECKPNCPLFELLSKDEAPRDGTLLSVVAQLKNMIDKREDAEVVEEWLEAVDTATIIGDLAGYSREWRAQLLLVCILNISGSMISTITGLADRYSNALRSLSLPPSTDDLPDAADAQLTSNSNALILTLTKCLEHEPGYLSIVLDIFLRRGIIQTVSAADWATSPTIISTLLSSHWNHVQIEVTVDRAIDIVRASTENRRELGGDLKMDESAVVMTEGSTSAVEMEGVVEIEAAVDMDEERERALEAESSRSRRRRDDEDEEAVTANGDDQEENADPIALATEAVLHALKSSREVYTLIVGRLLVALMRAEQRLKDQGQGDPEEDITDEWMAASQSVLLRVLRSYHGAEAGYLSQGVDHKVVLTSVSGIEDEILKAEREGVLESAASSAIVKLWRSFAY